jgi:biotin carboxyl carrier protein
MQLEVRWPDGHTETISSETLSGGDWKALGEGAFDVRIAQKREGAASRNIRLELLEGPDTSGHLRFKVNGIEQHVQVVDKRTLLLEKMGMDTGAVAVEDDVKAPMPGKVLSVEVAVGDVVEEGAALLVLEAMKMENVLRSSREGVVSSVEVMAGDAIEKGAILLVYES